MSMNADNNNQAAASRLVVGMGATGLSLARWLHARQLPFRVVDSRTDPPNLDALRAICPDEHLVCGRWPAEWFASASELYVSPGVPLADPDIARALARGASLESDVATYCRHRSAPIIAVTGSNGKSTVVTWLVEAARAAGIDAVAGGNIGTPVLDLLVTPHELAVLELSSFQLEMVEALNADVAMVLNVSPDHLDRYERLDDYRAAKHRIFTGCDAAVVNVDDPATRPDASAAANILYALGNRHEHPEAVTLEPGANGATLWHGGQCLWQWDQPWALKGRHNQLNALATLAVARWLNWPLDRVAPAIASFRGLPHRCEWVGEPGGVTCINDSKGTNVGATLAALNGLLPECKGRMHVLLGGDAKGADFRPLISALAEARARAYCFGAAGPELTALCAGADVPWVAADTLDEAFSAAALAAVPPDWILLSPACASLDQFPNYKARGDQFRACVNQLAASKASTEVRP